MGSEIHDQELGMTLLASLPEDFKPLSRVLGDVSEENLSFKKVESVLLNDADCIIDAMNSRRQKILNLQNDSLLQTTDEVTTVMCPLTKALTVNQSRWLTNFHPL